MNSFAVIVVCSLSTMAFGFPMFKDLDHMYKICGENEEDLRMLADKLCAGPTAIGNYITYIIHVQIYFATRVSLACNNIRTYMQNDTEYNTICFFRLLQWFEINESRKTVFTPSTLRINNVLTPCDRNPIRFVRYKLRYLKKWLFHNMSLDQQSGNITILSCNFLCVCKLIIMY